jgi:isopenicillin-N N-acyltransferase like protein
MFPEIPIITLSGTAAAMGQSFGEHYRTKIHDFAQSRLTRLQTFCKDYCNKALNEEAILHMVTPALDWHQSYHEDIWSEFCGIAAGANISQARLLIAMGFTDLQDYMARQLSLSSSGAEDPGGCSAFVVPAKLSPTGVLCGQTWDMSPEAINYLVLVKRKPVNAPETLYLTTMGCLGLIGLNSYGIAIGNTNLMTADHTNGVNYLFTISAALRSTSLATATGVIVNTPRLSGHNFYVADRHQAVNIEASAARAYCTTVNDQVFMHTNHCLTPSLRQVELPRPQVLEEGSRYRLEKLEQHLAGTEKIWDVQKCWTVLSDNTKGPAGAAVCNEGYENSLNQFSTVATCVLSPGERKMWVCAGGGRKGHIQEMEL